jgi:hypothetical protein
MVRNGENLFKCRLSAGDYMFMFVSKSEVVRYTLDYTTVFYIPLLKRLVDVGLVLIEVSMPLLMNLHFPAWK